MNGRKYGHNYHLKAHGFARTFNPVGYYAPKRPYRINEALWDNLIGKMVRIGCGGTPDELWSQDGRVRKICWGRTLGWWEQRREDQ